MKRIFSIVLIMIAMIMVIGSASNGESVVDKSEIKKKFTNIGFEVKGIIELEKGIRNVYFDTLTINEENLKDTNGIIILEKNDNELTILYPSILYDFSSREVIFKDIYGEEINKIKDVIPSPKINKGYIAILKRTGPNVSGIKDYKKMPDYETCDITIYNKRGEIEWELKGKRISGYVLAVSPDGAYIITTDMWSKSRIIFSNGEEKFIPNINKAIIENSGDIIYGFGYMNRFFKINRNGKIESQYGVKGDISYVRNGKDYIIISVIPNRVYIFNKHNSINIELGFLNNVFPLLVDDKYVIFEESNTNKIFIYDIKNKNIIFQCKIEEIGVDIMNVRFAKLIKDTIRIYIYMNDQERRSPFTSIYDINLKERKIVKNKKEEFIIHAESINGKGFKKMYNYVINRRGNIFYILK